MRAVRLLSAVAVLGMACVLAACPDRQEPDPPPATLPPPTAEPPVMSPMPSDSPMVIDTPMVHDTMTMPGTPPPR